MKHKKVRTIKNTWTCKCGSFYHRSTKYCINCPSKIEKLAKALKMKKRKMSFWLNKDIKIFQDLYTDKDNRKMKKISFGENKFIEYTDIPIEYSVILTLFFLVFIIAIVVKLLT